MAKKFEYINRFYGTDFYMGQIVFYKGRRAEVVKDNGNYVGIRFDGASTSVVNNVHPTDENLFYESEE